MLQVLQAMLQVLQAELEVLQVMLQVLQAELQVLQAELHKLCRVLRAKQSPGQQGELPDCLLQQQIRLN